MAQDEEKKIIIDEDWKTQAQQEKEQLATEHGAKKDSEQGTEHGAEQKQDDGQMPPLPPAAISGLVSMLATQAYYAMGLIKTEDEAREPDFAVARYNIDMLGVLQGCTKGNLSEKEQEFLDSTLEQIRMVFVQIAG